MGTVVLVHGGFVDGSGWQSGGSVAVFEFNVPAGDGGGRAQP